MTRHYIWDRRRFLFFPEVSAEYLARFTLFRATILKELSLDLEEMLFEIQVRIRTLTPFGKDFDFSVDTLEYFCWFFDVCHHCHEPNKIWMENLGIGLG